MRLLPVLACLVPVLLLAQETDTGSRLSELLDDDAEGFARAESPRAFSFPADHGPHPEFRNEWWYVTGNLDDESRAAIRIRVHDLSILPDP